MEQLTEQRQRELAEQIASLAATALEDKKGLDVQVLPVAEQTSLADFFVLATGTSGTHVHALADEAEFRIRQELDVGPLHIEGYHDNSWELLDYGSVVVHVFTAEGRKFYNLERLWGGALNQPADEPTQETPHTKGSI